MVQFVSLCFILHTSSHWLNTTILFCCIYSNILIVGVNGVFLRKICFILWNTVLRRVSTLKNNFIFIVTLFFHIFSFSEHYDNNSFFVTYFPKSILGFEKWTFINVQKSFSFLLLGNFFTFFILRTKGNKNVWKLCSQYRNNHWKYEIINGNKYIGIISLF